MGVFRRAWNALSNADNRFSGEPTDRPIDQVIAESWGNGSAPRVNRIEALSVPAVVRGRNLICGEISTLPLVQYGPDRNVIESIFLHQVDPDVTNEVTLSQTLQDLLFEGTSWWRITAFGLDGYPISATHLDVGTVSLNPPGGRSPAPLPSGLDPRGAVVYVDGKAVPWSEIIMFSSPNPGLLVSGGRTIRRAIALDKAAGMYATNPRPQDFFTPAEGADPAEDDAIRAMLSEWNQSRQVTSTAYVPAALKYNAVDTPTPAALQLVEQQQQVSLDIANLVGMTPEDVGVSTTTRTYTNAVDQRRDRINGVLSPYMKAITSRLSMDDVTKRGCRVAFDLDDYLRADPMTRFAMYEKAITLGIMTPSEVRAEEGLPELTASQKRELEPKAQPALPSTVDAHQPAGYTFDAEAHTFVSTDVQGFAVDTESRTISGLVLPYGKVAQRNGRRFRFEAGALSWSDLSRVKLLRDHDFSQALGKAVELTSTSEGFVAKFRVASGPEGDRALALAAEGVVDGFSVGVDWLPQDEVADPQNRGTTLVRKATLREVSLTAMPAFDDARVTRVAASRDQGESMESEETPVAAPAAPAFDYQAFAQALQTVNNGGTLAANQVQPEVRPVVNPTRTAQTFVNEASPYVFDRQGTLRRGTHEFSNDLFLASRGDMSAYDRTMSFVSEQFVITTDVDELNPVRNRPDMYVDQRDFRYPVWNAINKGTLTDITSFTFPKFNSAGSLVAAHVEGTEPSLGTFTATNQTVVPTAVSGKVKISRETFDQGGNPQVSNLIWRQMLKAWYEALEAAAVAVLDNATPTSLGTFTVGGGTNKQTLVAELESYLAALQYVRGGFSMNNLFAQVDLYQALVAAKDTSLRPYFAAIGPMNSRGTVSSRFGALDINGITAYPAWALAATGVVAASSYLFDSDSVHGWASAPQRIDIDRTEVANVYIGLWGYKATAISDINGVREVIYDPA